MANPFKFKTLRDTYTQSIDGKSESSFKPESKELVSQLKDINDSKKIGGYTGTLEKRFNYILKNQESLMKYFKSPEGIEFITKQELLYKSSQYLAPVTTASALASVIPGIPVVSSILNSVTGNYNIHRDFSVTNMIGQIAMSSLGLQGMQANFASRINDLSLKSLASLFVPAINPKSQSVYTAYIDSLTGNDDNIISKLIPNKIRSIITGNDSDRDRLVKLYNQLTRYHSAQANKNLDFEFNPTTRNKAEGFFGFGSFYNERSQKHIVSKPQTDEASLGELTQNVKDYIDTYGIGPSPNTSPGTVESSVLLKRNKKQYSVNNQYKDKLSTENTIYFFRTGTKGFGQSNESVYDFLNDKVLQEKLDDKNDLIKFAIEFGLENPNSSKYLQFRAYLNAISDNANAQYSNTKYVGRADQLYTYEGFTRSIGSGFTIYAGAESDLDIIYQKLNTLTSLLTPSYSTQGERNLTFPKGNDDKKQSGVIEKIYGGVPRAPIIKLTIGNYIKNQYGFLTGLSYNIRQGTMWDLDRELPHVIEVSQFSFTPIHNFVVGQEKSNDSKFIYIKEPPKEEPITSKEQPATPKVVSTLEGGTGNVQIDRKQIY